MKKNIYLLSLLIFMFTFISCASVPLYKSVPPFPKPGKNKKCLVYGKLWPAGNLKLPEDYVIDPMKYKSIYEVRFQNIKTKKIVKFKVNQFLEIFETKIPDGTYIFHSYRERIQINDEKHIDIIIKFDKNKTTNFHFIPIEDGVINLGKIYVEYTNYGNRHTDWNVDWDKDFQETKESFSHYHPNSAWLEKEWITRQESLERHLTLFP